MEGRAGIGNDLLRLGDGKLASITQIPKLRNKVDGGFAKGLRRFVRGQPQPGRDAIAIGLDQFFIERFSLYLNILPRSVNDLVGSDDQAAAARVPIFGEPADDVAPELAKVTVVALAPGFFEVRSPRVRGIGRHGESAALTKTLAREDRDNPRAGSRPA